MALFAAGASRVDAQSPPVTGVWIDHTGRGAVEIYNCGPQMCGRIAWLKDATDPKGGPAKDKKGRTLCGLQIIGDLKPTRANGVWDGGWIYDPDKDDKFDVEITLKGDRLQVMGYAGVKFLSETYVWKRAPQPFAVCDGRAS